MARSIFNGKLVLGERVIPVKLYSAVEPRGVHFRLLHAADQVPIRQRMIDPETGEEVPREQIRRGLELPEGTVVFSDEELAQLEPEPSRDIEIFGFVDHGELGPVWYARPYYLGPHGGERGPNQSEGQGASSYWALARAMADADKLALVRWTMRKHPYRGALDVRGDYLVLYSLRSADEVISAEQLPERSWAQASKREREMAEQLVDMLSGELELDELRDLYRERLMEHIRAKAEGRVVELPEPVRKRASDEALIGELEASIERARKEKRVA